MLVMVTDTATVVFSTFSNWILSEISEKYKTFYILKYLILTVCSLWLSLPGDYRVTDEALLAETM